MFKFSILLSTLILNTLSGDCFPWLVTSSPIGLPGQSAVVIIDTATETSLSPNLILPLTEEFPLGVAITPNGQFAYITFASTDNVSVIDFIVNPPVH